MIDFLSCQDKEAIEKLFLVHGDYEAQLNYAEELKRRDSKIEIPEPMQEYII